MEIDHYEPPSHSSAVRSVKTSILLPLAVDFWVSDVVDHGTPWTPATANDAESTYLRLRHAALIAIFPTAARPIVWMWTLLGRAQKAVRYSTYGLVAYSLPHNIHSTRSRGRNPANSREIPS
jgi:hypothetical protein